MYLLLITHTEERPIGGEYLPLPIHHLLGRVFLLELEEPLLFALSLQLLCITLVQDGLLEEVGVLDLILLECGYE